MSNDGVNAGRRRFLVAATSVVGAAGAVGAAVPFVAEILGNLKKIEGQLSDPTSKNSTQPTYVDPEVRSIKPEILLLIGICTHLGCSPTFRPEVAPADLGKDWVGGYFCPCHGSHYDLAGRVYKSQPAPLNLPVPPHSYETDDLIVIGVDTEKA